MTLLDESQLDALLDKLSGYAKEDERILVLARYHHLKPASLQKAATRWPKLQIDFMTIHASKGQQADYVILVGLQEGNDGFPAPARESIMESALLPQVEDFPDAEERRLLYVALTRARGSGCFLIKIIPRALWRRLNSWMCRWRGSPKARAVQHPARVAVISGARPDNAHNPE